MYLSSLRVHGLRHAEEFVASDLDRIVDLPAGPAGIAAADALSLLSASLDRRRTRAVLVGLGLCREPGQAEVREEDGFPVQISVPDRSGVAALLPVDGSRQITVSADFELDPPLFGRLRQLALRDPRLVTALGDGARVTVKVGWLFTNDLTTASVGVLGVSVGETGFALAGSDRPSWLAGLLEDLGGRFGRTSAGDDPDLATARLVDASLSIDPERRARFRRAAAACGEPPFMLGALEPVRVGDRFEARFGPGLAAARQFGPAAAEAIRLVEAALVEAPDVLVVESPGAGSDVAAVRGWLGAHTSGDRATLEQVFLAPAGAPPIEAVSPLGSRG